MAEKTSKKADFERSVTELEQIIFQMEQGDLTLEKTISLYEKGIKLTRNCTKELEQAKLKIEELRVDTADE